MEATAKERGMSNLAALILRVVLGSLLAGHGAQKLFGSFEGPGLEGTSGFMEMLGLRPGRPWAVLAGLSEFGGGVLTVLGLLNPLGPLGVIGSMSMATTKAHWGKPIWVTEGGAELPVLNIAAAPVALFTTLPPPAIPQWWPKEKTEKDAGPARAGGASGSAFLDAVTSQR